ncbi:transmembrane protein, putative (macronuclear) [Tetrahymena thermophila SB210]|uniref:Transmembrane protein, putative n=1 Tax=Tetrahymena thermophila (strain SB210) TaxID=312017 RepID=Q237L6_TETTS|nr:transmembrane protein, putative [Tetrahymena thermophila SB210]EAR92725.2 transmembrane protein, putative [Tetrahymena thermophila SB210]|eukprot:XP_001012970.2 transmembrane protein, putative [Tetrahymena thermophila SB210]
MNKYISKIDLFSQQFQFNIGQNQIKKSTPLGVILSLVIIIVGASYYSYLFCLLFTNQLEPNYKSQEFITEDSIDINLSQDLVGFRFEYDFNMPIDILQAQKNQTYLVYLAYFYYVNNGNTQLIQLNIVKCQNPNLINFYCLDFSNVSNYTLTLNTKQNIQSYVDIFIYGCLDQDFFKTSVPENCASQDQIDAVINGMNAGIRLKLFTSQFNVGTIQNQINYRNAFIYTVGDQLIQSTFKTQKSVTTVKDGLFVLSSRNYSSPIKYDLFNQIYDRQYSLENIGQSGYSFIQIIMDEIVQQTKIQYPTIPDVLALGNGIITLLMVLGIFGRMSSFLSIRNDFFLLVLQNLYQGKYLDILQNNQILQNQEETKQKIELNSSDSNQTLEEWKKRSPSMRYSNYNQQLIKTKQAIDCQQQQLKKFRGISDMIEEKKVCEYKFQNACESYNAQINFNHQIFNTNCINISELPNLTFIHGTHYILKGEEYVLQENSGSYQQTVETAQSNVKMSSSSAQCIVTFMLLDIPKMKKISFTKELGFLNLRMNTFLTKLDLFSSQFHFNIGKDQIKKSTPLGLILSLIIISVGLSYYSYLFWLLFTNQLEPNYKSQEFITEDSIDISLSQDLVGFRFEYDFNLPIENLQAQNNKTYLVYMAYFYYVNNGDTQLFQLNIVKCQNPNLINFYCLDFSNLTNYTLTLNTKQNIQSYIDIFIYGCLDQDIFKTSIPENCANQDEINQVINGINSGVRLKLFTSQFNVGTIQNQINYRNAYIYTMGNKLVQSTFKTQKSITTVKDGLFILSSRNYSSPIKYDLSNYFYDRQYSLENSGQSGYSFIQIIMDEIIQQRKIQYPTVPDVLALGNSIITLLMIFGFFGKVSSFKSIRKDFFLLILQNLYQGKYFDILQSNQTHQKEEEKKYKTELNSSNSNLKLDEWKKQSPSVRFCNYNQQSIKTKQSLDCEQKLQKKFRGISHMIQMIDEKRVCESKYQNEPESQKTQINFSKILSNFKIFQNEEFSKKVFQKLFYKSSDKKEQNKEEQVHNKKAKKVIEEQLNKHLDIFQIFQDVIFIKKAIMILLDKDQLATIRLVGCSSNYLDRLANGLNKIKINIESQNHFEEQLEIFESKQLQFEKIQQFLEKCKNNKNLDQIDKRILSSLV